MSQEDIEATKAPLLDHLIELRARLIKAMIAFMVMFVISFAFAKQIYNVLIFPYVLAAGDVSQVKLIYTAPLEYLFTQIKIAVFGASFFSFPVVATQIYKFVAPGLYKNERDAFRPYLIATPVLFMVGAAVVFFIAMPIVMRFSIGQQQLVPGEAGHRAPAQGQRIPVADHDADLRVRHHLPASRGADAAGARRLHRCPVPARQAALCHRAGVRDRRRADAARHHQPARPCGTDAAPLRSVHHRGADGRKEARGPRPRRRTTE